jgi:hypothetical protein
MTLQEIKDKVAIEWGYDDWAELCENEKDYPKDMADHYDRIAKRYAKAKLEDACNKINKKAYENEFEMDWRESIKVVHSILETPLD